MANKFRDTNMHNVLSVSPPALEMNQTPLKPAAMVGELYHLFSFLLSYSLNTPHVSFLVNNLTALINIDHLHLWSIYECWNLAATVLKMFKLSQYFFHLYQETTYLICWSKSGQNTMGKWHQTPLWWPSLLHGFIRHQSPPSLLVCYLNFVPRGLSGGLLQAGVTPDRKPTFNLLTSAFCRTAGAKTVFGR